MVRRISCVWQQPSLLRPANQPTKWGPFPISPVAVANGKTNIKRGGLFPFNSTRSPLAALPLAPLSPPSQTHLALQTELVTEPLVRALHQPSATTDRLTSSPPQFPKISGGSTPVTQPRSEGLRDPDPRGKTKTQEQWKEKQEQEPLRQHETRHG
ncbi:hypothetical protein DL95DRAFT_442309 [Leptodontidium sp. 2 PMI_412]|nr:hypothetical protein DL95DRAFT_442309 [Leptodontidium sp. 2 PMI_412]